MKHLSERVIRHIACCISALAVSAHAIEFPLYFKASRCHAPFTVSRWNGDVPYETADWRSSLDVSYFYGSTHKGWNVCKDKVSVLDINGPTNALFLFSGVPTNCVTNFADQIGRTLTPAMSCGNFGQLGFCGKFDINEVDIDYWQNLMHGFFFAATLPIRRVEIKDITQHDCSPCQGAFSQETPAWKRFKNNLNPILGNYCYESICQKYSKFGAGDLITMIGWHHIERDKVERLAWAGMRVQLGILFPTSRKDSTCFPFSVPTGYNKHWGFPIAADVTFGFSNWLSANVRAGAVFFARKELTRRLKTNANQNGNIKLTRGQVKEKKGPHWYVAGDIIADHAYKGFSLLLGYSFNRGEHDKYKPKQLCCSITPQKCCDSSKCSTGCSIATASAPGCCDPITYLARSSCAFNQCVINTDNAIRSWYQHVFHLRLDYDFSIHMPSRRFAPRLYFEYDLPFAGRHAFATSMYGGGLGLDVRW